MDIFIHNLLMSKISNAKASFVRCSYKKETEVMKKDCDNKP